MELMNSTEATSYRRFRGVPDLTPPPIVIDATSVAGKDIYVVRDDLLPGGTKQRGVLKLLQSIKRSGYTKVVYSSPFCGYAQVALSYCCRQLGLFCRLYCEEDKTPGSSPGSLHPYSALAQQYGSEIILASSLANAEEEARRETHKIPNATKVPLGFNCAKFRKYYRSALLEEWTRLLEVTGSHPQNLWLPVGSGTLATCFDEVLPLETRINAVNVRVLERHDERLLRLADSNRIKLYESPLEFHDPMVRLPSFPSNIFYDAKLLHFIEQYGKSGDVWWNVAR